MCFLASSWDPRCNFVNHVTFYDGPVDKEHHSQTIFTSRLFLSLYLIENNLVKLTLSKEFMLLALLMFTSSLHFHFSLA